ncbi:outer membrane receptor protein involved in Fe transport [Roseivirga ehrenbergii]|uniref:TonB-dependent receptor n=1 Tax=Roseivirga ehrenbergii (strain DSM 102268 / JCM 13514 / KCTC 12282 / NCIMB 14502 / KMM 6017) TaxID=279360 RepID=A0A150XIK3_ROSEK|nr:TonB-dependent receptor plug domain-containing protein [Roseivirga ehrenbergii]KYG78557.1 TonB-dependent receptor [Roseivirga ehrenbergii]TCL10474.1 outer membrane receptor protein involved in Fe transport [Roseivirga ehrenbergii]
MNKWFTPALIAISLFVGNICFSQKGKVSGKLTLEDGTPVVFAIVHFPSVKKHTLSDESGFYQMSGIPFGTYQLEISSIEINDTIYTVNINKAIIEHNAVLKGANAVLLNEVVVEGITEEREIETKGFAVEVLETSKAALQSVQTNDLLNRTAGIRVRQNGGLGSSVDYNLNGMSGNSVRIFIDGLPVSTYGRSFSLNSIPPALIERIEVYKGVLPAHLADDALGGAINVILKKQMANNLNASVSYGSFNTFQTNFSGMHRSETSGFTLKASGFYNYSDNDYEVWGKFVRNILPNGRYYYVRAKRFNDAYRSVGGQIALGFTDVKWADQFFFSFNASDDYNEIQHGTYMSIPYKGRFTESRANVMGLTYTKSDLLKKGLEFTFNGMYSDRNQVVNDTVKWNYNWFGERSLGLDGEPIMRPQGAQQGAPTINHINRDIATFRSGLNYTINSNHKVILNHVFFDIDRTQQDEMRSVVEREFIGTRDLKKNISSLAYELTTTDDRLKGSVFGKFYQQRIDRMDPVLVQQNGESVRVEDRVSSNRNATGYGTALSFTVWPQLIVMASAEKAVRMPSENEVFGSPSENIVENLAIAPEVSNNVNIGFQAGSFFIQEHNFSFSTTGFLRDTRDKIVQRINPRINDAVQTNPYENLGKTKSIGFEAEVKYVYRQQLNLILNMSRFNSVFNTKYDSNGNVFDNYKQQLPNEPYFTANAMAEYTFTDIIANGSSLNLSYSFGFVDRFYTTWLEIESFRTPRQFIHDLGVNFTFPNKCFVVSADVRNIFDKQVYDNFAVQKPGRAFFLKLNYTINNL